MELHSKNFEAFFPMFEMMISAMINVHIQVLSLGTDFDSCKSQCNTLDGHLPYSFEGENRIKPSLLMTQVDLEAIRECENLKKGQIFATFLKLNRFLVNCSSTTRSTERGQGSVGRLDSAQMSHSSCSAYDMLHIPV